VDSKLQVQPEKDGGKLGQQHKTELDEEESSLRTTEQKSSRLTAVRHTHEFLFYSRDYKYFTYLLTYLLTECGI